MFIGRSRGTGREGQLVKAAKSILQTLESNPELLPGSDSKNWIQIMNIIFEKEDQYNQCKAVFCVSLVVE